MRGWKLGTALCLTALLCGCAAERTAWETVGDETAEVSRILPEPYTILCALPQDASCVWEDARCAVYDAPEEGCTITKQVLPATTAEDAIRTLSGLPAGRLRVLSLRFGDLPAYRFAWCCETEEGTRYRQAMLVTDAPYFYALEYEADAPGGETAQAVFASFGLFYDEGV